MNVQDIFQWVCVAVVIIFAGVVVARKALHMFRQNRDETCRDSTPCGNCPLEKGCTKTKQP